MKPMAHAEAREFMSKWEARLADDNVEIWVGFDSDGPSVLVIATTQGTAKQWSL